MQEGEEIASLPGHGLVGNILAFEGECKEALYNFPPRVKYL